MDPSGMISDGASYNLAEIWPFAMNGGGNGGESGGGFGMRNLGQFVNVSTTTTTSSSANHEVSCDDPMSMNTKRMSYRKRHDEDDESPNGQNDCEGKRLKTLDENREAKAEPEPSSAKLADENAQQNEPPKQDYIHVRAGRGQATDSHSLAERARREKISERMKILQDLVPGCNKVIGKALVLDEIINYIQSLQRQVEFLSMKLETVNARMSPGIEVLPQKDFGQQAFDTAGMAFGSQASREYGRSSSPEWLHMQVGGGFERTA